MSDALAPYVPRLVVDWVADEPERRHRCVTGTLVFADISGFTALTERLAVRGKVGAEEMGDLLNEIFDKLLTAAYDFGANLIKWGGDAVLLLFDGPRHATRAAAAACAMQRVMRGLGKVRTSAGQVRLGMSIGINTGEVDFLLVGSLHRELIVTGPTTSITARMEQHAERGEILMSAATAALLPAACRGETKGDGVLLRRAPDIDERPNRQPKRDGVDVGIAMCSQLREHLRHGHAEFEHRTVTVGFLEIAGTDDVLAEDGPEALTAAVGDATALIQEAAADNDVAILATDVTDNGVKVILTSGVPAAAGDAETRMLATMRRIVRADGPLRLRGGVTRGRVFAGDYGPFYRKTYSITGDIVNLAARLMSKAEHAQLVTLPDVVERSRTAFEVTALPPFIVKGKAEPIDAVLVGAPLRRDREREMVERGALVGRDGELAVLLDAAERASAGAGQIVEIVGPPGMGKSRLTDELVARTSARVLQADGDIYARATPYQPMQRLLRRTLEIAPETTDAELGERVRSLVSAAAPDLVPWLPLIGIVAGADLPSTPEVDLLDPEVRRARLEAVTSDLLGRLLPEPVVLVFNDVQFMDDATTSLIRRLGEDVAGRPWVLLLTRRPTVASPLPPESSVQRIVLEPLGAADADRLVAVATEDAPLPAHRMRQLVERAGGNPLYLEQLVAGAREGTAVDELPDSLEGVIAARIDQLPARRRTWLRAVSVLGNQVEPEVLADVLDGTDLAGQTWDGLGEFISLHPDNQLRFVHHLVRLTAYEGLPFRRRAEIHARAADVLERSGPTEQNSALLSMHCFNGGRYASAWQYARAAGDQARISYAPAEAAECYRRAVAAAAHLNDRAGTDLTDVYEALAAVELDLGNKDATARALENARRTVGADIGRLARLQFKTADLRQQSGEYPQALAWLSRARKNAALGDPSGVLTAEIDELYARVRYRQGRYDEAIKTAQRAAEQAGRAGDRAVQARAWETFAMAAATAGREWDESHFRRSLELYASIGDTKALGLAYNRFGVSAYYAGRWREAAEHFGQAETMCRQVGREEDAVLNGANRAELLIEQGRFAEADPLVQAASRVWRASGARSFLAFALILRARICIGQADYRQAVERLEEARRLCTDLGESDNVVHCDALLAECRYSSGNPASALQLCYDALAAADKLGGQVAATPLLHRVRGYALCSLGGVEEGVRALEASVAMARARGAEHDVVRGLRGLLRWADVADEVAAAWQTEIAEINDRLGLAV